MTSTIRRAAVSTLAASALVLAGGTVALADDDANFGANTEHGVAAAGPGGAYSDSSNHDVSSSTDSDSGDQDIDDFDLLGSFDLDD